MISPRINNRGDNNNGRIGSYKGAEMLFASHGNLTIAVACSSGWLKRSVGYNSASGGITELAQFGGVKNEYQQASNGHIVLCGQVDMSKTSAFTLAVALEEPKQKPATGRGQVCWTDLKLLNNYIYMNGNIGCKH